jgi:flagellar motor switch protein FliM
MRTHANILISLGTADITVHDLAHLEPGDVIQLSHDATKPLDLLVEGITKFKCIPGVLKGQRAVKITESLIES